MPIKVMKNESLESVFACKSVSQENKVDYSALADASQKQVLSNAMASSPSVDSKAQISQSEVMERHNSDNPSLGVRTIDVSDSDDKTLADITESLEKARAMILEDVSFEPTNQYIINLEEQHCKDTETIAQLESDIECLQERLKGAMRRCDENRSETLQEQNKRQEDAAEAESKYHALLIESERRIEKMERQHEIEIKNLKHEIRLQDKALEKHAEDEKLIALLMKKGASYAERMASE